VSAVSSYFRLKIVDLARALEEDVSTFCFEHGAEGVSENLAFEQQDLVYEPRIVETDRLDLDVFFSTRPNEEFFLSLQSEFPGTRLEMHVEENRDWMEEWKKSFRPFCFAGPFWIVPSWCEIPPEAGDDPAHILLLDPGMAFGTGTHETTRLAAQLLLECFQDKPSPRSAPLSLLDVGTGTGILALVAHRLGAAPVVGIDNDPEAQRVSLENLQHNQASEVVIRQGLLEAELQTYDLVVANIIDGVLTLLQHELARVLKPGGQMVLSGILVDRQAEFVENFQRATGLQLLKQCSDGEWAAARLQKPFVKPS
jgi:ribosomal protein L11 methyltransferase